MSLIKFQKDLYDYYRSIDDSNNLSFNDFIDMIKEYKSRKDKFVVYLGRSRKNKDKISYVGTTIQYPLSRWFYHKTHNHNFIFEIAFRFDNEREMLDKEFELIQKYHPSANKITNRPQNYNVELTQDELNKRKGDPEWCQCCLKRRVNKGYRYCYYCSK